MLLKIKFKPGIQLIISISYHWFIESDDYVKKGMINNIKDATVLST